MTSRDEIKASRQETTEQPAKGTESGSEGTIAEPFGVTVPSIAKSGATGAGVLRRLKVLGPGVLVGGVFALWVAWAQMPSRWPLADRAVIWMTVMGGPFSEACWGWIGFSWYLRLGCIGMFLIPLHPLYPNEVTGLATIVGLGLWFFAGFVTAIAVVWGA